jgi:hypothetical protein
MKIFKLLLSFLVLAVTVITINHILPHSDFVIYGSLIFTAPGGIGTPFAFNMTSLSQFLTFNNIVPLTSLKIETQEDGVLHTWSTLSIAAINGWMVPGTQPTNIVTLRPANGYIAGKNVTISGVTSAAGAVGFYTCSDRLGTVMNKTNTAQILALNPTTFENFTAIFVPTMAAGTDTCEVTYANGHRQTYNVNELLALSALFQEAPAVQVNNINAYIHRATFTCVAATPAYVTSIAVKG